MILKIWMMHQVGRKEFFSAPLSTLWDIFRNLILDGYYSRVYCVIRVMQLLSSREENIAITEEVVKATARNCRSGKEVMQLLLSRDENMAIAEKVVKAAARSWSSGKEVMQLLLSRHEKYRHHGRGGQSRGNE
jgi:hypothetical protein